MLNFGVIFFGRLYSFWKSLFVVAALCVASYWHGAGIGVGDIVKVRVSGDRQTFGVIGAGSPDIFFQDSPWRQYIETHSAHAKALGEKYSVPPSIIIAAGILESDGGRSEICGKTNNHFGLKCPLQRKCKRRGGLRNAGDAWFHCIKYSDGYFMQFPNVMQSYIGYVRRLDGDRYAQLKQYYGKNTAVYAGHGCDELRRGWERAHVGKAMPGYACFAHGLMARGYAVGKNYGDKLIRVIETNGLAALDN